MWPPGPGSAMPRSSSTPTAARSSAGGWPPPCGPAWPWTRWRWPSGPEGTRRWTAWSTTPTAACSTWPSATPSGWPTRASSPPWRGWGGGTSVACTAHSTTSPLQSTRPCPTVSTNSPRRSCKHPTVQASIKPRAVQSPTPAGLRVRGIREPKALGEQAPVGKSDPDEHERDWKLVGEPFEVVGDGTAVLAVHVQEVHVVDDDELGVAAEHAVSGATGQLGGVAAFGAGVGVEPAEHRVQRPHGRRAGEGEVDDRDALVAAGAVFPVQLDLAAMEVAAERNCNGLFLMTRVPPGPTLFPYPTSA